MRTIPLMLIILLFMFILVGCFDKQGVDRLNEKTTSADKKIKLTIMHNWVGQDGKAIAMRGILDEFRTKHPEIDLVDEGLSTDRLKARLFTVAAADEMPDLFVMWPDSTMKHFVKGNVIQPIDDFLSLNAEWKSNFIPHAFDDYTVDGNIYSVPMNLAPTSIIYYNQKIFDRHGVKVPTTWDELLLAIEVFNENNVIPIALGSKTSWVAQSTIFSTVADRVTGTKWFYDALNQKGAKFTDPEFIEALEILQSLVHAGAFQPGFENLDDHQMMQLYFEEKSAMFINGGWATSNLVQNAPQEVLDHTHVTIIPPIEGGKGDPLSTSGVVGTGLGLSNKIYGVQKEAALKLFYALSGPEGQKATLDSSTLISYNIKLDESKAHPLFIELNELIKGLKLSPVYDAKLNVIAEENLNKGLQDLLLGAEPEKIAQQLQDSVSSTFDERKNSEDL